MNEPADVDDKLLDLARIVAAEAATLGIPSALIGALALAVHGYVRATGDADLGVCTMFSPSLQSLRDRLHDLGYAVTLRAPDDDDPLDGVLVVEDGAARVEVVNIGHVRLGRASVDNAQDVGNGLRSVRAQELIALKLYAGGRRSEHDVHALLDANAAIDLVEVERCCRELGLESEFQVIIGERNGT